MDFKAIKKRGFTAFRANMLLCIAVGLAMAALVIGSTNAFFGSGTSTSYANLMSSLSTETEEGGEATYTTTDENGEEITYTESEINSMYRQYQIMSNVVMFICGHLPVSLGMMFNILILGSGGIFATLVSLFLSNIAEVGCDRFYLVNTRRKAYLNEVFWAFQKGKYKRNMAIQLYRMAYIFAWSLLLIVPGVIKAYEYRLVPYLLAEGEERKLDETLQLSKELMMGHKKEAFLFDLSFLGWDILGAVTLGIGAALFTNPYKFASRAEFYTEIRRLADENYQGPKYQGSGTGRKGSQDPFAGYHAYQKK